MEPEKPKKKIKSRIATDSVASQIVIAIFQGDIELANKTILNSKFAVLYNSLEISVKGSSLKMCNVIDDF